MKRFYTLYQVAFFALLLAVCLPLRSTAQVDWLIQASASDEGWKSVAYGNGIFVAVANSGTGSRVMTSPNGITWTSRTPAENNNWTSVTFGDGLFVAVANSGTNRVMTSTDGITWTSQTVAGAARSWSAVTYGNSLFVAISTPAGPSSYTITSPDGINWTSHSFSASAVWSSITYGNGKFVAIANSGSGNRLVTSSNGSTWTVSAVPITAIWTGVTYGNGLFVAVASSSLGQQVITSSDGTTWTEQTAATANNWRSVTYGNGLFVAVASSGTGNRVMTSPDGTTWTSRTSAADNDWQSVTYGNGLFVAVANGTGTGNRVMTSVDAVTPVELLDFKGKNTEGGNQLTWTTANEVNNKGFQVERRLGGSQQATGDSWETLGFKPANNKASNYDFLDATPPSGAGESYYRLRQLDNDGKETLSKVISISQKGGKKLKVYPNPVSNILTIETNNTESFQIINLLGQEVMTGKKPSVGVGGIDVSALPQGNYVLKVGAEQVKFIKM